MDKRHEWLRCYIKQNIFLIEQLELQGDWNKYIHTIKELAEEINWAATEWEKCYVIS